MNGRHPFAQPLTLDFNVVTVRNPQAGCDKLGAATVTDVRNLCAALAESLAIVDTLRGAMKKGLAEMDARLRRLEQAPASSGTAGLSGTVEVNFGPTEAGVADAFVTVPGALDGAPVVAALSLEPTADHDGEDGLIDGLVVAASAVMGETVTILVWAPFGTWGRYLVNYHIL
jgi:hypothetical protein